MISKSQSYVKERFNKLLNINSNDYHWLKNCTFEAKKSDMESLRIEIINPKAKRLIRDLAEMNLIRIKTEKKESVFTELPDKLREQAETAPSLDEITREVESVRRDRYEKKKDNSGY